MPEVSADFVAGMEDVLDLYEEPYDEKRPVVCFDESSEQLIAEVRQPLPPAQAMKHLVGMYADAEVSRVVLDNLNTHKIASLYEAFPPEDARMLAKKLEFHYTPRHGSWRNIAEIEFAVLWNMCRKQRIGDEDTLKRVLAANVAERNAKAEPVTWRFTTTDARTSLKRLYPGVSA